jgi:hypothetical protein
MKMQLLQEMYELNQAFARVIEGLKRVEKTSDTLPEIVRQRRAAVVSIQVETNREFFDECEAVLNDDEEWAAKRLRECKEREGDREDIYVQVMDREAASQKKGLPPRVTILPHWDSGDEERYDEAQARKWEQTPHKAKRGASKRLRGAAGPGKSKAARSSKARRRT